MTDGRAGGVARADGLPRQRRVRRARACDALAEHPDVELVGVVTAPPRPAGRRQVHHADARSTARRELGIDPILTPGAAARAGRDRGRPRARARASPSSPTTARSSRRPLLGLPHGALNLHPSLLPRHRGATPIPATILAGDAETGVTLMRMDEGLDTGPIVAQRARRRSTGTRRRPASRRGSPVVAADLLARSLGPWLRGELAARPQPADGATLTRPLRREDGRLDPRRPAAELERQVRAYQPWPGTFLDTADGRLVVWARRRRRPAPRRPAASARSTPTASATADGRLRARRGPAGRWPADAVGRPSSAAGPRSSAAPSSGRVSGLR